MKQQLSSLAGALTYICGDDNIKINESLSFYTTFKVGGPADYLATPTSVKMMIHLITFAVEQNLSYFILGKGSNLIISDKGIRGLVISTKKLTQVTYKDNQVTSACGFELIKLSKNTAQRGLSGLEFACGIPGSVGGAIFMNAGAYEGEICQVLLSSQVLAVNKENRDKPIVETKTLSNKEHNFSYRHSILQDENYIHLSSTFLLLPYTKNSVLAKIKKLTKLREEKQPLDLPSAGSVFRRPSGYYTGKLIEDCGLKGFRIGDAAVSTKHCGFIVNLSKATANDILSVIEHVRETILKKYGVQLQTEVRFVGEK